MTQEGAVRSKFDAAKALDLPALCASFGWKVDRKEAAATAFHCPKCGSDDHAEPRVAIFIAADGIWRWRCKLCNANGSSVDMAAYHWAIPAREAVDRLMRGQYATAATVGTARRQWEVEDQLEAVVAVNRLIQRSDEVDQTVAAYLKGVLRIPQWVLNEAHRRSVLRTLPANPAAAAQWLRRVVGEGLLRDAGFLKPGAAMPAIAYRPLIFLFPGLTAAEFRLARHVSQGELDAIRYGAVKWPLWWQGDGGRVLIVDGGISLLSAIALQEEGNIMGLPSATAWKREWFGQIMTRRPNSRFSIGLPAQPTTTNEIVRELTQADLACDVLNMHKDWNELLRARKVCPAPNHQSGNHIR